MLFLTPTLIQITPVMTWNKMTTYSSIALAKGMPYRKFMSSLIWKLKENGQLQLLKAKFQVSHLNCSPNKKDTEPLSVMKLATVFLIISTGIFLSFFIWAIEFCVKGFRSEGRKRMDRHQIICQIILTNKLLEKSGYTNEDIDNLMEKLQELKQL